MDILASVTHRSDTGLDEDSVVNTFCFDGLAGPEDFDGIADALAAFYNTVPGGVDRIGSQIVTNLATYLSPVLDTTANRSTVKLYEIPAVPNTPMGSPVFVKPFTLAAPAGGAIALPSEVAVVVTLEAANRADAPVELVDGTRPKQRHTGRIFFGPLNSNAVIVDNGVARPIPALQDTLLNAMVKLDADVQLVGVTNDLCVYSRADNATRPVGFVSIDNAFDTQRRRGEAATARRRIAVADA